MWHIGRTQVSIHKHIGPRLGDRAAVGGGVRPLLASAKCNRVPPMATKQRAPKRGQHLVHTGQSAMGDQELENELIAEPTLALSCGSARCPR